MQGTGGGFEEVMREEMDDICRIRNMVGNKESAVVRREGCLRAFGD